MKILFTFKIREPQEKALMNRFPQCVFHFAETTDCEFIETADVIVTYGGNINRAVLDRAQSLKWLMIASAGVEKMPLAEIAAREITMTNVSGIHKTPMAESVLAHILALKRSLPEIYAIQETKDWHHKFKSTEISGTTALILGPGMIGAEIGRLLQAFNVRTIGCNRSGRTVESMDEGIVFDQLVDKLSEADFVISVLPSTTETRGLLTEVHFKAMKESAVFLNFGRGDLLDEDILIEALQNNWIAHAVLDVFETEPLPTDHLLWTLPNCTVSPHVSSKSGKYIERSLKIFEENLKRWLCGEEGLVNKVDPLEGY